MRVSPLNAVSSCSASSGRTTRPFTSLLTCCLLLAAPATAFTQSSPGRFEVTPYGGYRFGGTFEDQELASTAELADDASVGVIMNLRESENTQWELVYARQSTTADVSDFSFASPSVDLDLQSLQLGGTYLGDGTLARPYLAATLGGTHISPDAGELNSDTFWSFSIGTGLQILPSERLGLRVEARAWGTFISSGSSLFCTSGAQGGLCAIAVSGDMLWQIETFAGVVFRF